MYSLHTTCVYTGTYYTNDLLVGVLRSPDMNDLLSKFSKANKSLVRKTF